jgi:NTE family protein
VPVSAPGEAGAHDRRAALPGQIVLVLQGGGALGAYQAGVYQALHEQSIAPDWVIGTSIGAINAALIAGNAESERLPRLGAFWHGVEKPLPGFAPPALDLLARLDTVVRGVPGFFAPNPAAWLGANVPLGVEAAAYYDTSPLRDTLRGLLDERLLARPATRMTVGAVNVRSGRMRYFDSRSEPLGLDHVMASGALPPAFPAVRVGEEAYWDGGLYSNTPIEAVLDDNPRRDSVIFAVNVWQPDGEEPRTLWEVMSRQKDIQYASRADSHIARQQQIHHLRHVIRQMEQHLPAPLRRSPAIRELASWGCGTVMHVVPLLSSRLAGEDHTKDIDFSAEGIRARWRAGHQDTLRAIGLAPWNAPVDADAGVVVHRIDPA